MKYKIGDKVRAKNGYRRAGTIIDYNRYSDRTEYTIQNDFGTFVFAEERKRRNSRR